MDTRASLVANEAPLFVVCYDISDDRERLRVDKLLKGYGFRRQKSVFECRLSDAQKRHLLLGVERLNLLTGHLRIYRLQANSEPKVIGKQPPKGEDEGFAYTV